MLKRSRVNVCCLAMENILWKILYLVKKEKEREERRALGPPPGGREGNRTKSLSPGPVGKPKACIVVLFLQVAGKYP